MRFLTLSWGDGFRRPALDTAEVNVVASWCRPKYGDFGVWNELEARGHVIQPHGGSRHADKSALPFHEAQGLDREGSGPVRAGYLLRARVRLVEQPDVQILPACGVLHWAADGVDPDIGEPGSC